MQPGHTGVQPGHTGVQPGARRVAALTQLTERIVAAVGGAELDERGVVAAQRIARVWVGLGIGIVDRGSGFVSVSGPVFVSALGLVLGLVLV